LVRHRRKANSLETKRQADSQACALADARQDSGVSPDEAVAAVRDMMDSIGDTCPECPPAAE
jgi:hypothetical protein